MVAVVGVAYTVTPVSDHDGNVTVMRYDYHDSVCTGNREHIDRCQVLLPMQVRRTHGLTRVRNVDIYISKGII